MVGLYVLFKNRRHPVYVGFSTFALPAAFWAISYSIWQSQIDRDSALLFVRLTMAFCSYIPFGFLWFCQNLVEDIQELKFPSIYVLAGSVFFVANFTPLMIPRVSQKLFFPYWPEPGFLMHVFAILFFIIIPYSFYLIFQAWFKASGMRRWQLRWVTITTLLIWGGGSTNWFLWYDIPIPPVPNVFVGVFFLLLAYAIIRRQLFDVDTLADIVQEAKLSAMGAMAASINHEIRNPLYIVKGLAESYLANKRDGILDRLSAEERNKKAEEILEKTVEQISRAMEIMKRFSEFSRSRGGASTPEKMSLSETIENVLSFVGHELDMDKIKVEKQISPTATIHADRKQMEEVFLNLILNACQAMPNGGSLKIADEKQNGHVLIHISDTGEGIPSDRIKRIFDPFFSTKGERGTGLGLYIVRKLVERNSGKISVKSSIGRGTTFTLEFQGSPHRKE